MMKTRKLTVILHYEETQPDGRAGSRVVVTAGRLISRQGKFIPWFQITRRIFVAAVAALCREIAQREAFLAKGAA